ncbi:CARDB domain-containing protein [Halosegnis sp.]|uniref:CARDB domain-containing protein n=1 Tax=Halosegnis sp. TaxID=2864959 RepID=UPI0035D51A4E
MRRALVTLLIVLLALPSIAVAVPDARLAVSGLTVAPETPTVDEPVTVTATIRNSAGSTSPAEVRAVRLVNRDSNATLASAPGPGSLSPGDTLTVDLTHAFRTADTQDLAVVVVGEDDDGELVRVRRPLTIAVEQARPRVAVEAATPVAGAESTLRVTVANPNTAAYRNVVVRVDPADAPVTRRVVPALAGGTTATLNISYTPSTVGPSDIAVAVDYTTATGVRGATTATQSVRVAPLREDVGVAVEPADEPPPAPEAAGGLGGLVGSQMLQEDGETAAPPDALAVTVTNFGNAPLRDAIVVPRTEERRLPRVAVGRLAPGESRTVEVSVAALDQPARVTAAVRYETGGRTGETVGRFDYRPPTGKIRLTGIDVTTDSERVTVTGNAGNVGSGKATGVIVRVLPAEGVEPAYPSRDYFVGSVEASGFAPFELTATVDAANATHIPVEVRYRVDGTPVVRTVELPLPNDGLSTPTEESNENPAVAGVASLGVVLLAGGVVLAARRRR